MCIFDFSFGMQFSNTRKRRLLFSHYYRPLWEPFHFTEFKLCRYTLKINSKGWGDGYKGLGKGDRRELQDYGALLALPLPEVQPWMIISLTSALMFFPHKMKRIVSLWWYE